jgi:hypothetical protein
MTTAVAAFEQRFQSLQSPKRRLTLFYGGLFALALALSAWVGEFSLVKIAEGLPRIHEYVLTCCCVARCGPRSSCSPPTACGASTCRRCAC